MSRSIAENFNRLRRAHERYRRLTDRRQTDGLAIAYSEPEREFTFAKNRYSSEDTVQVKVRGVSLEAGRQSSHED